MAAQGRHGRWPRLLATGLAVGLAGAVLAGTGPPGRAEDGPEKKAPAPDGRELYTQHCLPCHGEDGAGEGPIGQYMDPQPRDLADKEFMDSLSDKKLAKRIRRGKNAMPSFRTVFTDAEMDALIAYIRTFSRGD